ncbi:MAG TPA: hypothetical protein PK079_04765 [Leptospiraceae bacterium]|nr:hypothetical protein [Leptospiraceae bacterium]HMW04970.1 hypothetical protein [Leptospiraceae bacterium]HMX31881.1 hypothetical protein [Leptospiraceae bacterium]HMY30809.1 hypothetical protein [Leptospiraceae bacterium]HMZ64270.1 hypothetical protein [Leptospiraceae bacterium]
MPNRYRFQRESLSAYEDEIRWTGIAKFPYPIFIYLKRLSFGSQLLAGHTGKNPND